MDSQDSALEAPQASFAHKPTGFRRMTPGLLRADRTAEKFTGLPEGVPSYGQLLAAFKAAAPRLEISPRLVHAVDWLFCYTEPQDWQPDSRPIVWPSSAVQERQLGLSETQAKQINRQLIEFGLVTMKDSPNGKRYGRRNKADKIIDAYGFDLSLFAVRHAEFVRLAAEEKAERRIMSRLKRRRTVAYKSIIQILETAQEYGFDSEDWQTLRRETKDLVRALKSVEHPDEMEAGVASLERRWHVARERIEHLLQTVDSDPLPSENRPHYYTYNSPSNLNKDSVIAAKGCSEGGQVSPSQPQAPLPQSSKAQDPVSPRVPRQDPQARIDRISAEELARLAPSLRKYLQDRDPDWRDIVDAADWVRVDLGVSKSLWDEACVTMGRERAAIAIALVTTKEPGHVKNPGGYFHNMVRRDATGELHLDHSIWGLRTANNPERVAARSPFRRPETV
jgi:replication initiation protein RepC